MANIILLQGRVWTGNPLQPWAEAVGISGERIIAVGSAKEVKKLGRKEAVIINLRGALILPGFIDCHTHFLEGGFFLLSIQLRAAKSRAEFISLIEKKAKELGEGEWILNGDWDHEQFDPPQLPRKEWIDGVTPKNPVCVNRLDGHMVLANSLALKIAGITKATPSPPGGEIQKDSKTGEPTGILKDAAMELVTRCMPEPSWKEKLRAAETALSHAAKFGVTSVHDMGDASHFEVYQELWRQGNLTCRIFLYFPITEVDHFLELKLKTPFGDDFLRIAGLKGFVDGSLGSSTALFFDPYEDAPQKKGLLHSQMIPEGIMEERIRKAEKAGLQVAIHAIGDRANSLILDIFEKIAGMDIQKDRRWRVEHAQHILLQDMERMSRLKIIASVQPYHAIDDGRWAEKKIGRRRCTYSYAFRSLLDEGMFLACGSDWSVAPLNPLLGIYAAVTRQTLDGKNPQGWIPQQKISLEEALRGYTSHAAYAEFGENLKGTIEKGKMADIVVVDRNIFKIAPEEIKAAKVIMTIVAGKTVYQKD